MPTADEPKLLTLDRWIFRQRLAPAKPGRVLLLIHGWTGDENSMWVFSRKLPSEYTLLAPRALFSDQNGGYSWCKMIEGGHALPSMADLQPAAESLVEFIDAWRKSMVLPAEPFSLMGFSQGAALAYVLALTHPDRIHRLAVLSGFLPAGAENALKNKPLAKKSVFVSHGLNDDRIPVQRARDAVELLRASEARVTYCEADIGHKVSKECIQGMEYFFTSII